jgi:SNF2 family DNA or RNA helicase
MAVQVEMALVSNKPRIALTSNEPKITNRCKQIAGAKARFDNDGEFMYWHYPLEMVTAHTLRATFPHLTIGPRLTEWAKYELKRRKAVNKLHITKSAEPIQLELVPKLAPTIWAAYQNRGFQTVVPAFAKLVGRHFNADQPGCGKTIEELGALVECGIRGDILVVALKNTLRSVWAREIEKWLAPDFKVEVSILDSEEGSMQEREAKLARLMGPAERIARKRRGVDFHFVMVNPEMIRWEFSCKPSAKFPQGKACRNGQAKTCPNRQHHDKEPLYPTIADHEWDAALADETHKYMMNANERASTKSQVGFGFQKLMCKSYNGGVGYKVGMSGTPFKGKPRRFWTVLHWLDKRMYNSQGRFNQQYFVMVQNTSGFGYQGSKPTDELRNDREKLFYDDLGMIMVRRTKRELHAMNPNWAPPEPVYTDVLLAMEGAQKRAYKAMEKDAEVKFKSGTLMANGLLAEMTRLKQLACASGRIEQIKKGDEIEYKFHPALPSCKWDWLKNVFLSERGILDNDGELKVGIGSQWVELLNLYAAQLDKMKIPYFYIHGGVPAREVDSIQKRWQQPGGPRVLLLSTMAGGVSLTLDEWVDDCVIDDETYVPDDQEQWVGRFHRTSRTDHQVNVYRLITMGTIDQKLIESNDALDEIQKRILDGRRGVEYMRLFLFGESLAA